MSSEKHILLNPRQLILVTGVGGSGKTDLCQKLVQRADAISISKDDLGNRFTGERGEEYVKKYRDGVYELVRAEIEKNLRAERRSLVVDGSFRKQLLPPQVEPWLAEYTGIAQANNARLRIIRLVVSESVLRKRIVARNSDFDKHKINRTIDDPAQDPKWKAWLNDEPIEIAMPDGSLVVNNDGHLQATLEVVLAWLQDTV